MQEALFHNTPIVGIPLGTDQKPNLMRAERHGYAIMLDWPSLNTSGFINAIDRVMEDTNILKSMQVAHQLFIDQKETPLERAVWWVEYALRHDGAQFLKPQSMNLTFFQYNLIDVILFLSLVLMIMIFLIIKCCKCFRRLCCYKSGIKPKTE